MVPGRDPVRAQVWKEEGFLPHVSQTQACGNGGEGRGSGGRDVRGSVGPVQPRRGVGGGGRYVCPGPSGGGCGSAWKGALAVGFLAFLRGAVSGRQSRHVVVVVVVVGCHCLPSSPLRVPWRSLCTSVSEDLDDRSWPWSAYSAPA